MEKFNLLYENILNEYFNLNNNDKIEKKYKSFEEFRHFCKELDIIVKLNKYQNDDKIIEASLYFLKEIDDNHKPIKFDYFNQMEQKYFKKYKNIFLKLQDYKKNNKVTLSGEKNSPEIFWG